MYKCNRCGRMFEEPSVEKDGHGFDDGLYEEFECCPYCGGDFYEVWQCEVCGKWESEDDQYIADGICEKCFQEYIEDHRDDLVEMAIKEGTGA